MWKTCVERMFELYGKGVATGAGIISAPSPACRNSTDGLKTSQTPRRSVRIFPVISESFGILPAVSPMSSFPEKLFADFRKYSRLLRRVNNYRVDRTVRPLPGHRKTLVVPVHCLQIGLYTGGVAPSARKTSHIHWGMLWTVRGKASNSEARAPAVPSRRGCRTAHTSRSRNFVVEDLPESRCIGKYVHLDGYPATRAGRRHSPSPENFSHPLRDLVRCPRKRLEVLE
jgi:hypothetical protein